MTGYNGRIYKGCRIRGESSDVAISCSCSERILTRDDGCTLGSPYMITVVYIDVDVVKITSGDGLGLVEGFES